MDESDRGKVIQVESTSHYYYDPHSKVIDRLLVAGFVFLNVLVMLVMVRFIPSYYHKFVRRVNSEVNSNTRHVYLSFYWGCALVPFFMAMVLCLFDLTVYIVFLTVRGPNKLYLWTCISIKFVVTVVELIVCAIVCKRNPITVHIPFQWCITNVLFCCCSYCCCSSTRKSKVVQTLALWGIMAFVQHITASLIPIGFAIISQPKETLSIIALIASTVFCTIIMVAHLLHLGKVSGHKKRVAFCTQIFAVALFIGLAVVLIATYILLLDSGYELGLGGFLGSLVPSVILSAVGWYVQARLLKNKSGDQHLAKGAGVLETAVPVIHQNAPDWNSSESDREQTPLFQNTN